MLVIADVPIQKILGAGADTCGSLSLLLTLLIFHNRCVYPLIDAFGSSALLPQFWSGPGIYCHGRFAK